MKQKLILVVDDEPTVLAAIRHQFETAGFQVITAEDGLTALRMARTEMPDLIILDLILPGLNGYQVCGMLKRDQNLRWTPILMLSGRSEEKDVNEGIRLGADAYVTKPYVAGDLLTQVQNLLRKAEEQRPQAEKEKEASEAGNKN